MHYVSQLINIFTANWDVNLINNIFPRDISLAILSINVPDPPCPDRLCWSDANFCYSVRSGYKALVASRPIKVAKFFFYSSSFPLEIFMEIGCYAKS